MISKANGMRSNPPNIPGNIEPATRDTMNAEWFAVYGWKAFISKTDKRGTAGAFRAVPLFQTAKKLEITTQ